MARPREFDEEQVLDQALDAFWSRGYASTSMSDLVSCTGLAKASLYNSFGDKHALFMRALSAFLERGRASLTAYVESDDSGLSALKKWLDEVSDMSTCSGPRKGCMLVNTAIELAPHDPEVKALIQRHEQQVASLYEQLITRGKQDGSISTHLDTEVMASLVVNTIYGLQVRGKLGLTQAQARETLGLLTAQLRTH